MDDYSKTFAYPPPIGIHPRDYKKKNQIMVSKGFHELALVYENLVKPFKIIPLYTGL